MPEAERKRAGRVLYAIVAVLTVLQGGCLLALVGAGAGVAATGYFYCKGRIYRDYYAALPDVRNAARAALLDLHFLILADDAKDGKAFLLTKTGNGKKVRIYIDCLASPIPAEGLVTRVSIRVGVFGNESVTLRLLDQIAWHLSHGPAPVPVPVPVPVPQVGAPTPIQQTGHFQTNEPPTPPQPIQTK